MSGSRAALLAVGAGGRTASLDCKGSGKAGGEGTEVTPGSKVSVSRKG